MRRVNFSLVIVNVFIDWEIKDRSLKERDWTRGPETESRHLDQSTVWEPATHHCTEGPGVSQRQTASHAADRGMYATDR